MRAICRIVTKPIAVAIGEERPDEETVLTRCWVEEICEDQDSIEKSTLVGLSFETTIRDGDGILSPNASLPEGAAQTKVWTAI